MLSITISTKVITWLCNELDCEALWAEEFAQSFISFLQASGSISTATPSAASGGYQPTHGDLDPSNPPRGGSGVPSGIPTAAPDAAITQIQGDPCPKCGGCDFYCADCYPPRTIAPEGVVKISNEEIERRAQNLIDGLGVKSVVIKILQREFGLSQQRAEQVYQRISQTTAIPNAPSLGPCPKCGSPALMCAACDYPCNEEDIHKEVKMKVFKMQLEGYSGPCVVHQVESVLDELRTVLPEMTVGDSFTIAVHEMDEEEYKNLPEFMGY